MRDATPTALPTTPSKTQRLLNWLGGVAAAIGLFSALVSFFRKSPSPIQCKWMPPMTVKIQLPSKMPSADSRLSFFLCLYGISHWPYWCPEGDLNPHTHQRATDFKSAASANFAIRAWIPTIIKQDGIQSRNLARSPSSRIRTRWGILQNRGKTAGPL
jgi:hypothetical protein